MPTYADLKRHYGHNIVIAAYGPEQKPENIAVECTDCGEVIIDRNKPVHPSATGRTYTMVGTGDQQEK